MIKLSICMPTYNFGAFIGETLSSIIPQMSFCVELIIVDGGSNDDTHEVVQRCFQNSTQCYKYYKQTYRGGIDKDMALSVELARGDYVWLFSSDDIMKKGAIQKILDEIEHGYDVYNCCYARCGKDIKNILIDPHVYFSASHDCVFNFADRHSRQDYFKRAIISDAFFGTMSSLIIKRSLWIGTFVEKKYFLSCWAHVARIFGNRAATVKFLNQSLYYKRGDNDSFLDRGLVHRMGITVVGFTNLANDFFGADSFEANEIARVMLNEFSYKTIIAIKGSVSSKNELLEFEHIIDMLYPKLFKYRILKTALHFLPPMFCKLVRKIYKNLQSIRL